MCFRVLCAFSAVGCAVLIVVSPAVFCWLSANGPAWLTDPALGTSVALADGCLFWLGVMMLIASGVLAERD